MYGGLTPRAKGTRRSRLRECANIFGDFRKHTDVYGNITTPTVETTSYEMHKMAAELKHFAAFGARFPKFTPILKENSRTLGEYG